jgi:hypothetical protein
VQREGTDDPVCFRLELWWARGKPRLKSGLSYSRGCALGFAHDTSIRAIECPCGHHLEAADDDELFGLAREHVDRDHPEMERSDEQLRERVAADAYTVQPAQ